MRYHDEQQVFKELMEEHKEFNIRKYCPVFEPEFETYTVKTKPPYYVWNWRLNYFRRVREQELRDEAMKAARLKCHQTANAFTKCSVDNPFEEPKQCKSLYTAMKLCFDQEFLVEMDKRRRDVQRNHEWWWRSLYDEDGEVGIQAQPPQSTYIEKVGDVCEWVQDKLDGVLYRHNK